VAFCFYSSDVWAVWGIVVEFLVFWYLYGPTRMALESRLSVGQTFVTMVSNRQVA